MANEGLRELSGRLQQIRDEERRQIARDLHDSAGQLLAALSLNIAVIQSQSHKLDSAGAGAVSENAVLVEQISREIRTISHLLHPPLLDVAGLASALRWYVDAFSERSKTKVDLDIPDEFRRLSDEMESAIFRMIQECLTNIHRRAGVQPLRYACMRKISAC
jgi:two-component system NarL family sensor kinase